VCICAYPHVLTKTPWRNGSVSDFRSEGCLFKSPRGQHMYIFMIPLTNVPTYLTENETKTSEFVLKSGPSKEHISI
jgi:hypothetical protein